MSGRRAKVQSKIKKTGKKIIFALGSITLLVVGLLFTIDSNIGLIICMVVGVVLIVFGLYLLLFDSGGKI
jgi:hypothetical protein